MEKKINNLIIVRGAGDLASGILWYLRKANLNVMAIEIAKPSCIRRMVSFSDAIYEKEKTIEGLKAVLVANYDEAINAIENKLIPILIDENATSIKELKPVCVIDAIIAKKNIGTTIDMAPLVIGVGPGFTAKVDCHFAIETMRGHNLARVLSSGSPIANTGVPAEICGFGKERVMYSPKSGLIHLKKNISDIVKKGDVLAEIDEFENGVKTGDVALLVASIDGVLRGILHDGYMTFEGQKAADIDPRVDEKNNAFTISDKARSIAGACLLCVDEYLNNL